MLLEMWIESPGTQKPSRDGINTHSALPMAQARPFARGGNILEAAEAHSCSILHILGNGLIFCGRRRGQVTCGVLQRREESWDGMSMSRSFLGEHFW